MFKFYKKFVLKYIITLLSLLFTINISYSQSPPVASNVSAATVKNTNASIHLVASTDNNILIKTFRYECFYYI